MSRNHARPEDLCLLYNVQGLTPKKLADLILWMRQKRARVMILTETKVSSDPADLLQRLPGAGVLWPGARLFGTPGTGHTGGVVTVLSPGTQIDNISVISPTPPVEEGRILRLDLTLLGTPVTFMGVYGPAQHNNQQRQRFFSEVLPTALPALDRPLVIGADMNCVTDIRDCYYPPGRPPPAHNTRFEGRHELLTVMATHGLADVWRAGHPHGNDVTHMSAAHGTGARLDRWLVNAAFQAAFPCISEIVPAGPISSDHLPVSLSFHHADPAAPRTRGLQGFPLLLLNIPEGVARMRGVILNYIPGVLAQTNPIPAWAALKELINQVGRDTYNTIRAKRQQNALQADAAAAAARLAFLRETDESQVELKKQAWQDATQASTAAWRLLLKPSRDAIGILDHLAADQSTYYFFSSARRPRGATIIRRLNRPDRGDADPPDTADLSTDTGLRQGLTYGQAFYSSASSIGLYRIAHEPSDAHQQQLLAHLPRTLDDQQAALAEGPAGDSLLFADDFRRVLARAALGKAPGVDGLPYEFYRAFGDILIPTLVTVFNAAFQDTLSAAPLEQLLVDIICLLLKPGQSEDELKGYRPITLLNCDIKLVMMVISARLKRPLDYLIDVMQSAFLRNRDISDNVRHHMALATRLRELGLPGYLVYSDQVKAYDTVHRQWLYRTMGAMGFHVSGVVRWCRILKAGTAACVRMNGALSATFPVENGLAQGGPVSVDEWAIVFQPLMAYMNSLRMQGLLPSIPLPSGALIPAIAAYADDSTTLVSDPDTHGPVIVEAFELSRLAGNPALSLPKTGMQHLAGPVPDSLTPEQHQHHTATGFFLIRSTEAHRHLGAPMTEDLPLRTAFAFNRLPGAMRQVTAAWGQTPCSNGRVRASVPGQYGRCVVARQAVASKMVYQAAFTEPTPDQLSAMQKACTDFVAIPGCPEEETPYPTRLVPAENIAFLPVSAGGISLPNLQTHSTAMLAKTAWQALLFSTHPWAELFRHEIARAVDRTMHPWLAPGPHWILTHPTLALDQTADLNSLTRSAIAAFLKLRVRRILLPEEQDFHSILLEPTFESAATPDHPALPHTAVTSPEAKRWLTLKLVREAYHQPEGTLSQDAQRDLEVILAALPGPWRAAIEQPQPPTVDWQALSAPLDERQLFQGPDPVTGDIKTWELWPSGRLHPLTPTPRPWVFRDPDRPALMSA